MTTLDTSAEFKIYKYKQGIKLVVPDTKLLLPSSHVDTGCTIGDLSALGFNAYFMNALRELQHANEACIQTVGYDSLKTALHRTIFAAIDKEHAQRIQNNDLQVIRTGQSHFFDEDGSRLKDEVFVHCLALKMPWYDVNNKIIGIFGFGMMLGTHALSTALQTLADINFIFHKPQHKKRLPGRQMGDVYLSSRETDILCGTVRGKTAKEIAMLTSLSSRTIEHHLDHIKQKFQVSKKSELIEKTIDYFFE